MSKRMTKERARAIRTVSILRDARELIATGAETYICTAIERVCRSHYFAKRLQGRVMSALDGHWSMLAWGVAHGVLDDGDDGDTLFLKAQALRVRWLDQWIVAIERKYRLRRN